MCNFAIVIGQFFGKIVNKLSEQVLTITVDFCGLCVRADSNRGTKFVGKG